MFDSRLTRIHRQRPASRTTCKRRAVQNCELSPGISPERDERGRQRRRKKRQKKPLENIKHDRRQKTLILTSVVPDTHRHRPGHAIGDDGHIAWSVLLGLLLRNLRLSLPILGVVNSMAYQNCFETSCDCFVVEQRQQHQHQHQYQ